MEKEAINSAISTATGLPTRNFYGDLNTMHEAEKMLQDQYKWNNYVHALKQVASPGIFGWQAEWAITHATAAQRAEAFLRTIGRWEDNE